MAQAGAKTRANLFGTCLWLGLALGGCSSFGQLGQTLGQTFSPSGQVTPQERIQRTESRLQAAGFSSIVPQTPEEMRRYANLPPGELTYRIGAKGQMTYYFADPTYCHCYFSGSDEAYQRYMGQKIEARQTRRDERAEQLNGAAVQMQQMQLMGPFGIDSPLGGTGPGSNPYSY